MSAAVALGISIPCIVVGSCCAFAYRNSMKRWWRRAWRRLRVRTLGGVTTLERKLSYNCAICVGTMDAGEVVRTLSCNHVFHCRDNDKCEGHIDKWLRNEPRMSCPTCRKTPRLVMPWKAPPPASPESANQESSSSSSGLEDTAAPPRSPTDLEDPPLLQSSPVLEEPLLEPAQ
ncbi:unnamed protein product [Urochloa decumbens]|uniref:RING-type domain-containing protein n=1 Tax=Urochloa decumbens TaxID=240449 RepID=A0ABC9C7W2_9POAL